MSQFPRGGWPMEKESFSGHHLPDAGARCSWERGLEFWLQLPLRGERSGSRTHRGAGQAGTVLPSSAGVHVKVCVCGWPEQLGWKCVGPLTVNTDCGGTAWSAGRDSGRAGHCRVMLGFSPARGWHPERPCCSRVGCTHVCTVYIKYYVYIYQVNEEGTYKEHFWAHLVSSHLSAIHVIRQMQLGPVVFVFCAFWFWCLIFLKLKPSSVVSMLPTQPDRGRDALLKTSFVSFII